MAGPREIRYRVVLDGVKQATSEFDKFSQTILKGVSIWGAYKVAVGALEAQSEAEAAINKLNLALANQGKLTGDTSKNLQAYAAALQQTSTFADDTIMSVEAMAVRFGMSEEQIKRATQAAADFASFTGKDLESSMQMLGKAFVGNTTALQKMGFEFGKGATDAEKFESALSQIEKTMGGAAQAATKTFSGSIAQLKNDFNDAQEGLGFFLGELLRTEDATGQARSALQSVATFLKTDMVLALSEARAQWLEFRADLARGVGVPGFLGKLGGALGSMTGGMVGIGSYVAKPEDDPFETEAAAVKLQNLADKIRAQGEAAAKAGANTQTFANSVGGATQAVTEGLTEFEKMEMAMKALAMEGAEDEIKALKKMDDAFDEMEWDMRREAMAAEADVLKELGEGWENLTSMDWAKLTGPLQGPLIDKTKQEILGLPGIAGNLTTRQVSQLEWSDKMGVLADLGRDLGYVFDSLGIKAESAFGKIIRGLTVGADSASSFLSALASPDPFTKITGIVSAGLGFLGGIFGLFGGGGPSKEEIAQQQEEARRAAGERQARINQGARQSRASGIEGIQSFGPEYFAQRPILTAEDAKRQGTMFAAAWGAVVKEKGIVAAADAFGATFKKMTEDMASAGIDIPEWMRAIGDMVELGLDEEFRNIAEQANTAAQFLKALGESGVLGPELIGAFEDEARRLFGAGKDRALGLGATEEEAIKAGFGAANPLLKELLNQSILQNTTLSDDIQKMIDEAGIVPDVEFQQLDELRMIRQAVQNLAGIGGGDGGGGGGGGGGPQPGNQQGGGGSGGGGGPIIPKPGGGPGGNPFAGSNSQGGITVNVYGNQPRETADQVYAVLRSKTSPKLATQIARVRARRT